jgi:hypothetical protein
VRGSATVDACVLCQLGEDSENGSVACRFCAPEYYRPHGDSPASECTRCDVIEGVSCGRDTTIRTLAISTHYWRHSANTTRVYRCKQSGDWTPCVGGVDGGQEGDGYCEPGYHGPRCELCVAPNSSEYSRYFFKLDAKCYDCGDVAAQAIAASCLMLVAVLGFVFVGPDMLGKMKTHQRACGKLIKWVRGYQQIWTEAGMQFKVKALVGLYQCVAAIPTVFDMDPPSGLEQYTRWMHLLELPADLSNILIPAACFGSYDR